MSGQQPDLADLNKRMDSALEVLRKELQGLRTGRASASLLEPIVVEAYGIGNAAHAGGHRERARASDADRAGVGSGLGQGGREGHPQQLIGSQSGGRRPASTRAPCRS